MKYSESSELEQVWEQTLSRLEQDLGAHEVDSWLRNVQLLQVHHGLARLAAPSALHANRIRQRFHSQLKAALQVDDCQIEVREMGVEETLPNNLFEKQSQETAQLSTEENGNGNTSEETEVFLESLTQETLVLKPEYTFVNYVVGPCNRFAHAAARGVADRPATAFNPLFLHGPVGVGKTHLMQAIAHHQLDLHNELKIVFLSCEQFVNHFIQALQLGNVDAFRHRYRLADVLVVDDIQLLANKARTQEEFFHTFNTLHNAQKQIVLSSDCPPQEIPALQERLVSRFKWGLVAEIESPCFETRVAILNAKAQRNHLDLPDEVSTYIAEQIENNVRELEGTLTHLMAMASLTDRKVDLRLAKEVVVTKVGPQKRAVRIDDILTVVTTHYGMKVSDLQSKRRTQSIVLPRQVAMYLTRHLTDLSLEEIGGFFGGRDHSTVLYAIERIEQRRRVDSDFATLMSDLERQTKQAPSNS